MSLSAFLVFLAVTIGIIGVLFIVLLIQIFRALNRIEKEILPRTTETIDNFNCSIVTFNKKLNELDLATLSSILGLIATTKKKIEPIIMGIAFTLNLIKKLQEHSK